MKNFAKFCAFFLIFSTLFFGGVSEVCADEETIISSGNEVPFAFSSRQITIEDFKWSIGDYLTLSAPQLTVKPATGSLFNFPGAADIVALWDQESIATFMGFKIKLAPGQLGVKYETGEFFVIDATRGLSGMISGSQDIFGPIGIRMNGEISFVGDAYIDLVNPSATGGQGKLEFPLRLNVPIPGFGDCFAYSKGTADVFYQEKTVMLKNIVLENSLTRVTGEATYNLETNQSNLNLEIFSDSDKVKFLMSGVALVSGVTKLGSGHWKYEFSN